MSVICCLKTQALWRTQCWNERPMTSILQPVQVQFWFYIWYKTWPRNSLWSCDIYLSPANRSSRTDARSDNDQYICNGWPQCKSKRQDGNHQTRETKHRSLSTCLGGLWGKCLGRLICTPVLIKPVNEWISILVSLLITWAVHFITLLVDTRNQSMMFLIQTKDK